MYAQSDKAAPGWSQRGTRFELRLTRAVRNGMRRDWTGKPIALVRVLAAMALTLCAPTALAEKYELPLFVSSTTSGQHGMVRVLNHSDKSGSVSIVAINDTGTGSNAATLALGALAGVNLNAKDLESGNAAKGVTGGVGSIQGHVRIEFDTELWPSSCSPICACPESRRASRVGHVEQRIPAPLAPTRWGREPPCRRLGV